MEPESPDGVCRLAGCAQRHALRGGRLAVWRLGARVWGRVEMATLVTISYWFTEYAITAVALPLGRQEFGRTGVREC